MPITATAQGRTFTFPDGTNPEQMGVAIDEFFSGQQAEAQQQPEQQQEVAPQEVQPQQLGGGRSGRGNRLRQERARTSELLKSFEAGDITSKDLTPNEVEQVRAARIEAIPEITGSFSQLSENLGFKEALATMTAFDPDEFGKILTASDPNIGVVTTTEGERIAINRQTDEAFSINKTGPSLLDAVQGVGAIAALTPAGAAKTIIGRGVAAAGTQAVLEAGQVAAGGDFNAEQVALAGVAGPVLEKTFQGAKSAIGSLRGSLNITPRAAASANPEAVSLFANETPTKQTIREIIESGADDGVVARKMINGAGKVKNDPVGKALINQGIDEGTIAAIKGSSSADKTAFAEMLKVVEKGLKNKRFASQNRPSDIVGKSLVDRVKVIRNINKQAGKDVNKAALGLKGKQADLTDVAVNLEDDLLGFGIIPDGKKLDFSGSIFDSESLKQLKKPLQDLWTDFDKIRANPDGLKVHQFKKLIDNLVDFGKSSDKPLTRDIENVAKRLRGNVNESLRDLSNEYKVANTRFSESIGALDDFQQAAGSKIDLTSPNADKSLGVLSRRLLSNVQSRVQLMDSIAQLESTAKRLGGRVDDDIFTQVMLVDELENAFGSFAPTSIQGVTEKAIKQGVGAIRRGPTDVAIDVAAKVVEKSQGINEANKLKLLKQLVDQLK